MDTTDSRAWTAALRIRSNNRKSQLTATDIADSPVWTALQMIVSASYRTYLPALHLLHSQTLHFPRAVHTLFTIMDITLSPICRTTQGADITELLLVAVATTELN
jgi:hypothetical protein